MTFRICIHLVSLLLFLITAIFSNSRDILIFASIMAFLSGILVSITAYRTSRPLKELTKEVKALGLGDFSKLSKRSDEFSLLIESFRSMAERLEKTIADLQKSEEKFRTVADFTADWEYWIDPEGTFLYISPSCETLTGYRADEFYACAELLIQIIHPEDKSHFLAHISSGYNAEICDHTHSEFEIRIITKTGDVRWLGHNCRPVIGNNGQYLGRRASNRDITERKQAEDEICRLNEELEQLVEERTIELQRTNKELAGFCYAISHELRGPLARLNGFSMALQEECEADGSNRFCFYADRIGAASLQLQNVIDALLMMSRLSRSDISLQKVNLSAYAAEISQRLISTNPDRIVRFSIAPDVVAFGDPDLLKLLLENLLGNAFKYTAQKPEAEIKFGCMDEGERKVYFVTDNGVGFEMEYVDKLFVPFQRLHRQEEFPGTGIGLATVSRIIDRHGGRIWAKAKEGEGATFYFTLDQQREDSRAAHENTAD